MPLDIKSVYRSCRVVRCDNLRATPIYGAAGDGDLPGVPQLVRTKPTVNGVRKVGRQQKQQLRGKGKLSRTIFRGTMNGVLTFFFPLLRL